MTDPTTEERLETALRSRASRVDTETPDLLAGARRRASARRRTTVLAAAGSVAAVVLAGILVPGMLPGRTAGEPPVATQAPAPTIPPGDDVRTGPDGWQQVVFDDITFAVPADWGRGAVDQWCIGSGGPVVQLPQTVQTEVACQPLRGLGVVLTPPGQTAPVPVPRDYPDGTWLAQESRAGWTVTVSAGSARVRDQVPASIRVLSPSDRVAGCPARLDVPALGKAGTVRDGAVAACIYGTRTPGPNLQGALALDDDAAAAALAALSHAPDGSGPDADPDVCDDWPEEAALALVGSTGPAAWVHFSGCDGHGVDLGAGDTRRLTEDVMQLVLDVGWSGAFGAVPLPGPSGTDPDGAVSSGG
jgi:hypothetical protein